MVYRAYRQVCQRRKSQKRGFWKRICHSFRLPVADSLIVLSPPQTRSLGRRLDITRFRRLLRISIVGRTHRWTFDNHVVTRRSSVFPLVTKNHRWSWRCSPWSSNRRDRCLPESKCGSVTHFFWNVCLFSTLTDNDYFEVANSLSKFNIEQEDLVGMIGSGRSRTEQGWRPAWA